MPAAVMALAMGGALLIPAAHVAAAPIGAMSVTITPVTSPLLLLGKAAVTASVSTGSVARKGEVLRFAITTLPPQARVDTNTVKLPTGGLALGVSTITFPTAPSGFWIGETVNIVDPTTHNNEKVTIAGAVTTPPTPVTNIWALTLPTLFSHSSGSITGTWDQTDPITGAAATATLTAGAVAAVEQLTVTDLSDPTVPASVTSFTQSAPILDTPTQKFVRGVYVDLLNRQPDAGSLSFWSTSIDASGNSIATRGAFVTAITSSAEYRADVISNFFGLYLNRGIDQSGLDFWVGQMAAGLSFEQVRLAFVGSPEFFNVTNAGSPSQAINALYREVLGRADGDASDPAGLAYWLANFNITTIASQFLFSLEGRESLVSGYYSTILHRAADLPGLIFWTQRLLTGASDENILLQLLSSNEFTSLL
jgi:hypothetical protein